MVRRMAAAALVAMVCSGGSAGALGPFDAGADISVMSKYIWRGIALNSDPVLQPSATIGYDGFTFGVWTNMDLTDVNNDRAEFNEVDYSLDYTLDFPLLSVFAGIARYDYSIAGWEPTTEAYLGVESGFPGSPSLTVYQDVDKSDGTYLELGAGQSFPVVPFASLDLSAMLGWGSEKHNRYNYDIPGMGAGFTNVSITAGLPVGIGEMVSVTPSLSFVAPLSSDIRDNYDDFLAVFGISASVEF